MFSYDRFIQSTHREFFWFPDLNYHRRIVYSDKLYTIVDYLKLLGGGGGSKRFIKKNNNKKETGFIRFTGPGRVSTPVQTFIVLGGSDTRAHGVTRTTVVYARDCGGGRRRINLCARKRSPLPPTPPCSAGVRETNAACRENRVMREEHQTIAW